MLTTTTPKSNPMDEQSAIEAIDRMLDEQRQALKAMPLVDLAWEYTRQFNQPPDFAAGADNMIERIIADRRQKALRD